MKLKVLKDFIGRYWILIFLLLLKFILQFMLVNPVYELHRDEFLHLDQADHLAFGFISVPPFTALVSKLIFLLGGNIFWIRFFPALFGALTIVFVWLTVEATGGNLFSRILASTALLFSVMMRINVLYQPSSFDILAWTMIFYLQIRYVQSDKPKWLYILVFVVAAGFYNKYNIVFLLFGLVGGLGLTSQRSLFRKASLWKALFILVLLLMPNLIWQFFHHCPVVEHMKVLKIRQLDNNTSLGFLKDQTMFFS
ncbi:MAG: glycosyltransferase family 39 protein, partial [Bacteroidota bacterium]|nr:glycosyltransferase family 39 protein [Bacteroidota bacterium]